jgi:hypothetical protein
MQLGANTREDFLAAVPGEAQDNRVAGAAPLRLFMFHYELGRIIRLLPSYYVVRPHHQAFYALLRS